MVDTTNGFYGKKHSRESRIWEHEIYNELRMSVLRILEVFQK